MKASTGSVEDAWDRSHRDLSPSDSELSDYDPGYIATANLDISNRFDLTEFTKTPFTIAQGRAKAKAKGKPPTPDSQSTNSNAVGKKEEKKGKSKSKKSSTKKEEDEATEDIVDKSQDTKEDTEDPLKTKKKQKKLKFGGHESYAEWDAAEERAARAGGPPIVPAAIQPLPAKKEEKKRYSNWKPAASGWLDSKGNSKPTMKTFSKNGFTSATALETFSGSNKRKAASGRLSPTLIQRLDAVGNDTTKKSKTTKAPEKVVKEKKEPAKRGKVAAKETKAKGRGKKDNEAVEPSLKFGRLPAGAAPNDDFPILKGFEKMKSLPVKQRPARLDLDKLIPLTKSKLAEQNKQNASSSKNKTYKSDEIIIDDDDNDNESVDPPSDTEATLHASSATLKGSGKATWFSELLNNVPEEVKIIPSVDRPEIAERNDDFFTPETSQQDNNPSTMTHLSNAKLRVSDYATSSSQLPYSSPVLDKYGRTGGVGIINPIPVRDKSSQIAHLQKMANQGQSRQNDDDRKSFAPTAPFVRTNPDREHTAFHEDEEEEVEPWSTLQPRQSRYASKSMSRKDDYQQSSSRPITALFPQRGPSPRVQDRKPVTLSRYSKITVFQPPARPAQPSNAYTIAAIPNGARKVDQQQQQYHVEEMQWTGTPRGNMQKQNPPPKDLTWLRTAEAARPGVDENWKDEWKNKKPKRDISNNSLGKYALNKDMKRGEVEGQGRAFRT